MSLASDYAVAYVASQMVAPPSPFIVPEGRAEVTSDGTMRLVQTTEGEFLLEVSEALALRDWITATFG